MGPASTVVHGSLIIIEFILWRKEAYLQPARTAKPDLRRHVATRGGCREGAAVSLGGVQLHCVCVCIDQGVKCCLTDAVISAHLRALSY